MVKFLEGFNSGKCEVSIYNVLTELPMGGYDFFYPEEFNNLILRINNCIEVNIKGEILNPDEFYLKLRQSLDNFILQIDSVAALQDFESFLSHPANYIRLIELNLEFNKERKFDRYSLGRDWEIIPYKVLEHDEAQKRFQEEYSRIVQLIESPMQTAILPFISKYFESRTYNVVKANLIAEGIGNNGVKNEIVVPAQNQEVHRLTFGLNHLTNDPLDELFDFLKKDEKLIAPDTSKAEFKSIFGCGNLNTKVDWIASVSLLNCLVRNLPSVFIPLGPNFPHFVAASDCFTFKQNPLTADQLRNNRYQKGGKQVERLLSFLKGLAKYNR